MLFVQAHEVAELVQISGLDLSREIERLVGAVITDRKEKKCNLLL